MWKVTPPTIPVSQVLDACASTVTDSAKKARYLAASNAMTQAEAEFWHALQITNLHNFPQSKNVLNVTKAEMEWLYTQKMARQEASGRQLYDQIKMAAPNGKCPLCGRGAVYSLDHHLPKAHYVDLAISPKNLVPSCQDCNKSKLAAIPSIASEETINPYVDDVETATWLRARVVEVAPAAFLFFVDSPAEWPQVMRNRVSSHFRNFKLRKFYASEAATLLANIRTYLSLSVAKQGVNGIRAYCHEMAESCLVAHRNSWEAAAYTAMAESDWFCNGGYAQK